MSSSSVSISPLTPSEVPQYIAVRHESFRQLMNKIFYTREPSQATFDQIAQSYRDGIARGEFFLKATDDKTGEIIAGAKWRYVGPKEEASDGVELPKEDGIKGVVKERTWEEVDAALTVPEPYVESNPELWNALFAMLNSSKREVLGTRPYFILDTLVTHPSHHRRGAGAQLVQWGCDQADSKGVVTYLEASQMGLPLYERFGFQRVKDITVDLRQYGAGEDVFTFTIMLRPVGGTKN